MTGFSDADLAAISEAYESEPCGPEQGSDVEPLVAAAQSYGFLEGIVVYSLAPVSAADDSFSVTAVISPSVVAGSTPYTDAR